MCGRYTLHSPIAELKKNLGFEPALALKPRFNIAPFEMIPIATHPQGPLQFAKWGLIPSWSKKDSDFQGFFNIPYDGNSLLIQSLIKKNRATVPANGFYVWKNSQGKKQPFYFHTTEGTLFHFAALRDTYLAPYGEKIETVAILVKKIEGIGNFPLLVPPAKLIHWLDGKLKWAEKEWEAFFVYNDTFKFKAYPVSTLMNAPEKDAPICIAPLAFGYEEKS